MFKAFADLIASHLDAQDYSDARDKELIDQRQDAELREQFIAVLGHDLRNPLAAIEGGIKLLSKRSLDDKTVDIIKLMQDSVTRMSELIDSVFDFARGRLGGGIALEQRLQRLTGANARPDRCGTQNGMAGPCHRNRLHVRPARLLRPRTCGSAILQSIGQCHHARFPDAPIRTKAWTQDDFFDCRLPIRVSQFPRLRCSICSSRFTATHCDLRSRGLA